MAKDVIVVVQRDALPKDKESLDILLVSTTGAYPVQTYRDIESVKAVFGPDQPNQNMKVVRKATTLLNQGKTTLAETLVNKFKIVGLETPKPTPAAAGTFVITFPSSVSGINESDNVYVRIGGDDEATVELTAEGEITTGSALAALFTGTSFTKGGKTYSATAADAVVTFTATTNGLADTGIPEKVELFKEEGFQSPLAITPDSIKFTNGVDAKSAADNLVEEIKKFQTDVDNDWYFLLTDRDDEESVTALAKFAEASEPTEAELGAGVEDHRKFYMGQTDDKTFANSTARAAVIYTDHLEEEADASYAGNVAPFYPLSVTWKFKRPQDGNADTSAGIKVITLPQLTEGERDQLLENHVNFLTEEYKRQYVKDGVCLNGEFIDVVLGGDWIAKRMRDLLYDILLTNPGIEYSDAGFGLVATAVLQALAEAVDNNIIARDSESKSGIFTVVIPKYAESTEEQRRNRVMPDITWEAQLAGAIHQVKSKGVLRASL